jgi:alpha-1,3-rhamnosyl/mannosyltransferase
MSLLSERVQPTGVGTYGLEVARALGPLLAPDERLVVVRHRDFPACGGHPAVDERALVFPAARTAARRLAEQTLLPAVALRARAQLVHTLNYVVPAAWRGPSVLTLCDDRVFVERAARGVVDRAIAAALFRRSVRRATRLTAISTFGALRCARTFGVAPSALTIAPPGVDLPRFANVDDRARAAIRARLGLADRPVVLFVGEVEPHKNVPRLVDAFAAVAARDPAPLLVLAGGRGSGLDEARGRVRARGLDERVRWPPYLARADLAALVASATALALVSLDEGFGMPVVEAFAAGTPVLASTGGALPETAGGAALCVEPTDVPALAAALERLLGDPALREDLVRRGRARAAEFTWTRAAQVLLGVYREAADVAR